MKILLTGADGFTGRWFSRTAQEAGHEVVALRADLTQAVEVLHEVHALRPDAVVHLAAIAFVGHANERALYDVNLFGTLNLLNALKATGSARRILLASSANIYGNCEQSPIAETQVPAPVNHYAMSKLAMEHMARTTGLPLVFTRPFNYTGPGQEGQFVIPKLVEHFRHVADTISMGNLYVEREYNDVRFVSQAYLRLLAEQVPLGTYNVCTGRMYDFSTVLDMLMNMTGHKIAVRVDPKLVRSNEVHRLCGDPSRLRAAVGDLPDYPLQKTLAFMLEDEA